MNRKVAKKTIKRKKKKSDSKIWVILAFAVAIFYIYKKTIVNSPTGTKSLQKVNTGVLVNKSERKSTADVLDEIQCVLKTVSCKTLKLDSNKGEGVLIENKILYIVKKDTNLSFRGGALFNNLKPKDLVRAKSYITLANSYIIGHLKFDRKYFNTVRVYIFSGPIYDKKFSVGYEIGSKQAREINIDALPALTVEVKQNGNIKLADEYLKNKIIEIKED